MTEVMLTKKKDEDKELRCFSSPCASVFIISFLIEDSSQKTDFPQSLVFL